jgi:hypothetical protein
MSMLPSGHIAAGVLVGAARARFSPTPAPRLLAAGVLATTLPDLDLLVPSVLDRLGVPHGLQSGVHHRWMTHTPLFWAVVGLGARRAARHPGAPPWAPEAAALLATGAVVHLTQDTVANTVSLLWPLRHREYGLQLDRLAGVTDHVEYVRRYPASPAGWIEGGLVAAALAACARLRRRRRGLNVRRSGRT